MKLQIEVKSEDIRDGRQGSHFFCPVALAITRAIKDIPKYKNLEVSIGIKYFHLYNNKKIFNDYKFKLPNDVGGFIERFDDGMQVDPISFEVNLDEGIRD